jgi:uncharacterized membrane protein (UPF0136 family)
MLAAAIATFIYSALAIVGGVIGYVQAGSKVSLISGIVSGLVLLVGGIGIVQSQPWGLGLAIAVTLLLIAVFVMRLIKTRKVMPAGLMVVVGVVVLIGLLAALGA